ncbi:MAG: hypothetical protein PHQ27_06490 [Victivallales bacterium]|nr:hypothetical protein [Victivallales bacterium]
MNLQAREVKTQKKTRRSSGRQGNGSGLPIIFHLLAMGAVLFFIVNYRISLRDDIGSLSRNAENLKRKIHRYDRELEHLKLKKENLCRWNYIRKKIAAYKLPLTYPEPGQVKVVVIDRSSKSPAELFRQTGKMMVSQR